MRNKNNKENAFVCRFQLEMIRKYALIRMIMIADALQLPIKFDFHEREIQDYYKFIIAHVKVNNAMKLRACA